MCGAEASALTPLLVIRPGCGLNWLVHRHQHLQARVQRSLASAGGRLPRLPDASVDSPGATKNTSSLRASVAEARLENPDRDQRCSSSRRGCQLTRQVAVGSLPPAEAKDRCTRACRCW